MSGDPKIEKKKMGRPTLYSQEMADLICLRTATCSFGLRKLCTIHDDLPTSETVYQWRYQNADFSAQYAQAKLKQADFMAEEILEISDDGNNDWMEALSESEKSVGWKLNGEHVQRSRLRIDTRKWLASKLLPKTYGTQASESDEEKLAREKQERINKRTQELLDAETK